jgi:hypothetical protein
MITYNEANILVSIDCQGCWRQRHSESEPPPRNRGELAISSDGSISLSAGIERDAGVGLGVHSMCSKILSRGADSCLLVRQHTNKEDYYLQKSAAATAPPKKPDVFIFASESDAWSFRNGGGAELLYPLHLAGDGLVGPPCLALLLSKYNQGKVVKLMVK